MPAIFTRSWFACPFFISLRYASFFFKGASKPIHRTLLLGRLPFGTLSGTIVSYFCLFCSASASLWLESKPKITTIVAVCAPLAIAAAYRLAMAGSLHIGRGVAPPLLIPPTSHPSRQAAANSTVKTVKLFDCTIFFAARSSLCHLALATLVEKTSYLLLRCGGVTAIKPKIRQNNVFFRLTFFL